MAAVKSFNVYFCGRSVVVDATNEDDAESVGRHALCLRAEKKVWVHREGCNCRLVEQRCLRAQLERQQPRRAAELAASAAR